MRGQLIQILGSLNTQDHVDVWAVMWPEGGKVATFFLFLDVICQSPKFDIKQHMLWCTHGSDSITTTTNAVRLANVRQVRHAYAEEQSVTTMAVSDLQQTTVRQLREMQN